jgi:zinc transport system substrate-binding protein
MTKNIADALAERDPDNAPAHRANAEALIGDIETLDREFRQTVDRLPRRTLVFGERFAFGYLFSRYGLEEEGAYKSCAPGAEPGLKATIAVVEYVKKNDVRYIYREETARPRISNVIQKETGAEILTVDSMHTIAADKMRSGAGYVDIMKTNMDAFAKGLE